MKEGKGRNRTGSLYRRWKGGKYKVNDPAGVGKGIIYLRYSVGGKVIETSLKTSSIEVARKKQLEVMKPLELASETEVLEQTELRLKRSINEQQKDWQRKNPPLKVNETWEAYLKAQNRTRPGPRTMGGYTSDFRLFYEWLTGVFPEVVFMKDVGVREAEAYAEHLDERNLSPASYNHHLNTLTMVWAVLYDKAQATSNPFAWDRKSRKGVNRRSVKSESYKRKKRPLSVEEVERMLDVATGDYRTLIIILVCTGQRLVDAVKLEWSAIDFDRHLIKLLPQKTAKRTGKPVCVPLLPQLEQELIGKDRSDRYVLPKVVERYEEYTPSASKKIKSLIVKAGIETKKVTDLETHRAIADVGAHSLRHTFVTVARMAGIPDPLICQVTGHSSQEMMDHYTQFSDEMVASLAGRLLGNTKGAPETLPFAEMTKDHLSPWALEKVKKLTVLSAEITGKENVSVIEAMQEILGQLV